MSKFKTIYVIGGSFQRLFSTEWTTYKTRKQKCSRKCNLDLCFSERPLCRRWHLLCAHTPPACFKLPENIPVFSQTESKLFGSVSFTPGQPMQWWGEAESSQTVEEPEFSSPWLHTLATELSHVREGCCTVTTLLEERFTFSRFCC